MSYYAMSLMAIKQGLDGRPIVSHKIGIGWKPRRRKLEGWALEQAYREFPIIDGWHSHGASYLKISWRTHILWLLGIGETHG